MFMRGFIYLDEQPKLFYDFRLRMVDDVKDLYGMF